MENKILLLKEHNHFYYSGCCQEYLKEVYDWKDHFATPKSFLFRNNENAVCFKVSADVKENQIDFLQFETSYYIGLQYIPEWNMPLLVEPKMNNDNHQLNFIKMLTEALQEPENFNHLDGLMEVDFNSEWIEVPSKHRVELTPFLIIQFLMAVKQIVIKGLKKSYYQKTENLRSRVKGKILVGQQLKQNVFKHRLTHTVCSFQEFGFDTEENRFLKYVLQIIYSYAGSLEPVLKVQVLELVHYNFAAFQQVNSKKFTSYDKIESNPFYKVYNNAFGLGNQILKMISHSYGSISSDNKKHPPHWIDMSKLFELYVFKKLREIFTGANEVKYHEKKHYQELDFIINENKENGIKAVVDAKYKPRYKNGSPAKEDVRQLSGYSRLNSVYEELGINDDQVIPVYIIYPKGLGEISDNQKKQSEDIEIDSNNLIKTILQSSVQEVKAYRKMYMQEIPLETLPLKEQ
ncbi:hypothetical protein SD427_08560 [Chryseobacterium sp. JJR-5R]|uniref:5-methylcytosine restriction system specificity protein McrC n=1 Tax=Chryseobacterium sp. JJR-5R TaxID=3093923 RepID=UPI002A760EDB|nr:hypothetical protein [Chryseobacterium sp. JJR-5R]WPO84374.1 hypothetical protein SD427_08560 [Chryseobacterium sp. JJR-5R]